MSENVFFFLKPKACVKFLYDNLTFSEALELMRKHGFTAMPVIDKDGHYMGTVNEGDFLYYLIDHQHLNLDQVFVSQLMRDHFMEAAKMDCKTEDLFAQSLKQNFVPIVDDRDIFIGIVTRQSIINYLMEHQQGYLQSA